MDLPTPVLWLAAGLVLMLLEMAVPGVFLMWLGLAALGTGLLVQLLDPGFAVQVVVFGVLAAVAIAVGLRFRVPRKAATLNTPTAGLVGREAVVLAFHGPIGRVRVGDSDWSARLAHGTQAPAAEDRLRVVGVDGTTLIVGA